VAAAQDSAAEEEEEHTLPLVEMEEFLGMGLVALAAYRIPVVVPRVSELAVAAAEVHRVVP
jgi:hypothetical protein